MLFIYQSQLKSASRYEKIVCKYFNSLEFQAFFKTMLDPCPALAHTGSEKSPELERQRRFPVIRCRDRDRYRSWTDIVVYTVQRRLLVIRCRDRDRSWTDTMFTIQTIVYTIQLLLYIKNKDGLENSGTYNSLPTISRNHKRCMFGTYIFVAYSFLNNIFTAIKFINNR